jgi:TatD DNase family protein
LEAGIRHGCWFGIGGFLTFKNHPLAGCIRDVPRDALLLETDAPYLAPHPMRGRRNEPGFVVHVARRLAQMLDSTDEQVAELTRANFERFLSSAGAIDPAQPG